MLSAKTSIVYCFRIAKMQVSLRIIIYSERVLIFVPEYYRTHLVAFRLEDSDGSEP